MEFTRWLAHSDRKPFLVVRINPSGVDAMNSELMQHGFRTTSTSKRQLVDTVKLTMQAEPQLLAALPLLEQLKLFREEMTPQLNVVYKGATGKGEHDDLADAAALCLTCDSWLPPPITASFKRPDGLPSLSANSPKGFHERLVVGSDADISTLLEHLGVEIKPFDLCDEWQPVIIENGVPVWTAAEGEQ